jgi:hypothetical protein
MDVDAALAANRAAVDDMIAAARRAGGGWTVPRAPGKWSPAQLVEHVARALEESANVVAGSPSKFPTLPFFVRPVIRGVFFNRVLKNKAFPKARTSKAFNPASGPPTAADAAARLEGAHARFERECRTRVATGQPVVSGVFGAVSVEAYAEFQAIHTRHHCKQLEIG